MVKKKFDTKRLLKAKSKEDARDIAIDYQQWVSEENLSYGELAIYGNQLRKLGKKYGILREIKENGII